ncbi:MAG: alkaline phosphatase family protein, partial [Myxococcota bacterium]
MSVEQQFGEQLAQVNTTSPARDPAGRKLYILMVDSLSIEDAARMPHFTEIGAHGFRMEMEPCFDNFTTACVREMLTGRRMFSLFSVLENLQVTRPGVGANLITDAQQAGLSTALVSWGDLRAWSNLVDTNLRLKGKQKTQEAAIGLDIASTHDVVFHHWIWHDVASHHHAKKNGPKYAESLARTDELIREISAGLPPDMDLIVAGDHGHAPDGRHVQGMDVPTVLVARSPNLRSVTVEGRPPITAARYLMGAITGVGSHASQVETPWRSWPSAHMGTDVRDIGKARTNSKSGSSFPKAPVMVAVL